MGDGEDCQLKKNGREMKKTGSVVKVAYGVLNITGCLQERSIINCSMNKHTNQLSVVICLLLFCLIIEFESTQLVSYP